MAGTETHGFDMVMEFAENLYRDLLGVIFDSDRILEKILAQLGINVDLASAFSVDVFLDRPSDPGIPAGASDLIDIRIQLGEGGTGSLGQFRIVAEVDVDHSLPLVDLVRVNLREKLHVAEANVLGFPLPAGLFATVLRNMQQIVLLGVLVDRATTTTTTMREADVRVVDDPSAADRDAIAHLFTFGGGAPGARGDFTRSFISPGGNGGIAVSFDWMCRIISPAIDTALQLDGAFTNCRLTRTVRFDEEEEVDLTALSLTPEDGFIRVAATVRKSGFCYEASGTVAAKIKIEVRNGSLIVATEVEDPDVDVDIPWYCWIAGAVIGALLGGILFGAIGAIVGGVLVPLIQWMAAEVIEGIVEEVAERIVEAINDLSLDIDVPLPPRQIILFSDVFIDDVVIGCVIEVVDDVPIRSQGTVLVPNGAYVDLDSGRVGDAELASADLAWLGRGFGRQLRAVCGARLARTWATGLDGITRSRLYRYQYEAPSPVPLPELAQINPLGGFFGDRYRELRYVYGVRTNEGRYSAVQVVEVEDGFIRLRYRTFEKRLPTVQIKGGFSCEPRFGRVDPATVRFVPSPMLVAAVADVVTPTAVSTGTNRLEDAVAGGRASVEQDPCEPLLTSVRALLPRPAVEQETLRRVPLEDRRIGRWVGTAVSRGANVGRFDAVVEGFSGDVTLRWRIDDHALTGTSGVVHLPDAAVHYQVRGQRLVLSVDGDRPFEFLLTVVADDGEGTSVTAQRCVKYENTCTTPGRYLPSYLEFKAAYMEHFGIVEVERERRTSPVPRGDRHEGA